MAWEQAHEAFLREGDARAAARCAFWAGFILMFHGHMAQAGGWLARAERTLAEVDECSDVGLPARPGVPGGARVRTCRTRRRSLADRIVDIAHRCDDHDLLALGLLCQGEAAIALGQTAAGMRLLDDAMVSVTTGEVSPIPAGIVYCGVIAACIDAFDLRRAAEWTEALTDWCEQQPDLVPFRGQCLVHRSEVLQAHGSWPDAAKAAEDALRYLSEPGIPPSARRSTSWASCIDSAASSPPRSTPTEKRAATAASRRPASSCSASAQGQVTAAVASMQRVVEETRGLRTHPAMLAAAVDVLLAAGDVEAARDASEELEKLIAGSAGRAVRPGHGRVLLRFGAARRRGCDAARSSSCDEPAPRGATSRCRMTRLEPACRSPAPAARSRTTMRPTASSRPPSRPSSASAPGPTSPAPVGSPARQAAAPGELTARQCDVLRVVATGKSNREVAAVLGISEHTVARHLQNIFTKLDLPSRAAATTYAHEHGLI